MRRAIALATGVTLALALGAGAASASAEAWMLMARHGECSEIALLKRKLPDLPVDARDPTAFLRFLDRKGLRYTTQLHPSPDVGPAVVEVQAPDAGLALLFVPARLCRSGRP
jgi:hypothetical protein